jgi:hypothetical protein
VFGPVLRDNVEAGVSVEETLRQVGGHAARFGRHARGASTRFASQFR